MADGGERAIAALWQETPLAALPEEEWERLCDRCGLCCLNKLEDEESGEIFLTRIACPLYDATGRRCRDYEQRTSRIDGCLSLRAGPIERVEWLPESCAYRLIAEGRQLADWHPLNSGNQLSVVEAGVAVSPDELVDEGTIEEEEWPEYLLERETAAMQNGQN